MIRALLLGLGLLVAPASGFIRPVSSPRQGLPRLFATSPGTATPNPALLLSPLSGRTVEIFETEDSTERFIQVQFAPDGTFNLVTDSTNAVNLLGTWQQIGDGKLVFVLERFYEEGTSKYSLTRLYEGEFIVAGRSVRGEGKVEMEKYKDVIPVGHFSIITIDDGPDELFDKVTHRDATDGMIEGLDF